MNFTPKGVLPAMITPLTKDGKINIPALRKLIDFLINGGVHGIYAMGTTAEFYAPTNDEYREVLEATVDHVAGRVPVYAGVNAITTRDCIELTNIASSIKGIGALSALTPYFISVTQNELRVHFEAIAKSTHLPIILYDNSPKTHISIKPDTVEKLAATPNIVAIKDSSGDLTNTADIIRRTANNDNFHVLMGRDSLIHAALCYGATGAVAACANVAPKLVSSIYDKYVAGDIAGSLADQYTLVPLRLAFGLGSFPAVIKESLELLGIEAGPCAAPVGPLSTDEREYLKKILIEMELLK